MPECACGCGQKTSRPEYRYVRGHAPRVCKTKRQTCRRCGKRFMTANGSRPAHYADGLPISPDIIHRTQRIMVMVDGCYWHECPLHGRGRRAYVRQRDGRKTAVAESAGWRVARVWEHEVIEDIAAAVAHVSAAAA